ncbi:MAG: hypothetical protein R3A10_19630 [Caldilineaceae bacterium]
MARYGGRTWLSSGTGYCSSTVDPAGAGRVRRRTSRQAGEDATERAWRLLRRGCGGSTGRGAGCWPRASALICFGPVATKSAAGGGCWTGSPTLAMVTGHYERLAISGWTPTARAATHGAARPFARPRRAG